MDTQTSSFVDPLDDCGLSDVISLGDKYTWCNVRKNEDIILARLDKFVCSSDWQAYFPSAVAEDLGYFGSDQRSVSLKFKSKSFTMIHN